MAATPEQATDLLKSLALRAGFDLVGVARAEPLDGAALDRWLEAGHAGTMRWMARGRDARVDPARLLPGVRSVVSLAVNYYRPGETRIPGEGRISRYAWGRDYHKVLQTALRALRRRVARAFPQSTTWGGVDAVPILEKVWAERAGLGWVAKSGNLITPRFGSWVFLATLLTDLELVPDAAHPERCGSCTDCIPACPTAAIVAPGVVDARRCLSYLTIEVKGPWPEDAPGNESGWLFGCDVCQDVCPWSRKFARPSTDDDFAPRPEVMGRALEAWESLDEATFDRITRGSALRRAGREGLMRNARAARQSPDR